MVRRGSIGRRALCTAFQSTAPNTALGCAATALESALSSSSVHFTLSGHVLPVLSLLMAAAVDSRCLAQRTLHCWSVRCCSWGAWRCAALHVFRPEQLHRLDECGVLLRSPRHLDHCSLVWVERVDPPPRHCGAVRPFMCPGTQLAHPLAPCCATPCRSVSSSSTVHLPRRMVGSTE